MCYIPDVEGATFLGRFFCIEQGGHPVEERETGPGSSWAFDEKFSEKTCSQNMDRRIRIIGPRDAYVLAALLCVQFSTRTNADESVRASGDANRRLHGSWSEWREASKRAVPT